MSRSGANQLPRVTVFEHGSNVDVPLAETVVGTITGVPVTAAQQVLLRASCTVLIGVGTTLLRLRLRRGLDTTGAEVQDTGTPAVIAGGVYTIVLDCHDSAPNADPTRFGQYAITLTPQNGAGDSTCQLAFLAAQPYIP